MNDYYDKADMKAVDYIEAVLVHMDSANAFECCYEVWHVGNALKYALRAGEKPNEDWRENCRKCADYLCRFKTGRFIAEKKEDFKDGIAFTD